MQSRRHSLEEVIVSTASGLLISLTLNWLITPIIVGHPVDLQANVLLTGMFTIASIVRGYFIRRRYNRKALQK